MIDLYGLSSPNVMKVVILLEEVGLGWRLHPINIWAHDQFTDAFRALNPNCKAPVIVDPEGPGGEPITVFESGAILIYLAEKTGRFMPTAPRERYAALQWLMLQMASIGPMFGQSTHFRRSAPPGNEYSLSRYVTEVHRLVGVLQARLEQAPFLAGSEYSVADMAAYPWVSRYHADNGVDLADYPAVGRWLETIGARPAVAAVDAMWGDLTDRDLQKRGRADDDGMDHLFGRGRYARHPTSR